MKKIDWARKLSSRKFWALLAALATSVLTAAGAGESVALQVTGVIGAVGACVAYMLAEGLADSGADKTEE
ncbi:hypothetical protein [Paenibacillus tengchongensis]|uniref:hypothetical protein n=1 Tax=Paenibacillus tengchongensis TaxID=2608684 RepID=UPI00124D0CAB|nr:hypothetical protein [Paenibacillus tengchongensis]